MFENFPDVMTVKEASVALGIGKNKLYEIVHAGGLSYFKNGRQIKIPKKSILCYIDQMCYNITIQNADESPERRIHGDE